MTVESQTGGLQGTAEGAGRTAQRSRFGLHQIPNALCVLRVILVFASMYFIAEIHRTEGRWSVFWFSVATLAALTDKLDGWLAKRYGWTSRIGAYLDHVSDKMVTLAIYAFCVRLMGFPLWAFGALIFRELFVTGMRTVGNQVHLTVSTSQLGRVKTFAQQLGALIFFCDWALPSNLAGFSASQWFTWVGNGAFFAVLLITGKRGWSWLREEFSVKLPQADGEQRVSYKDFYLFLITFAAIFVPVQYAGPSIVAFITVGSGLAYLMDFSAVVRHGPRPDGLSAERVVRVAVWGNVANFAICAALTAVLCYLLHGWSDHGTVLWSAILGFSALWAVFLMVNYFTSPEEAAG